MIFRTARVVELCHHVGAIAEDWCNLTKRVVARVDLVDDLARSRTGVKLDLVGRVAVADGIDIRFTRTLNISQKAAQTPSKTMAAAIVSIFIAI